MDERKKSAIFNLSMIFVVFAGAMVLAAILVFNPELLQKMGKKNIGNFIEPRLIDASGLVKVDINNPPADLNKQAPQTLDGYWTYVTLSPSKCDNMCKRNLQFQLRVRLLQGRDVKKTRVMYIMTDKENIKQLAADAKNNEGAVYAYLKPEKRAQFMAQFKVKDSGKPETKRKIYLLDPCGALMMHYDAAVSDKDGLKLATGIRKDLYVLLRSNKTLNCALLKKQSNNK